MSRRRRDGRGPAELRVFTEMAVRQIYAVLATLSEREAGVIRLRLGLTVDEQLTLDEVAQVYGVTRERIRQIESKTLAKLRHRSRSDVLEEYANGDLAPLTPEARARILGSDLKKPPPLVYCDRHGWSDPGQNPLRVSTCAHCPCVLPQAVTGRQRMYCSSACRQAAYRGRKSGADGPDPSAHSTG